jgi:lycopene beta-cyclase
VSSQIDIAIIGGGSAGMSLAANLADLAPHTEVRVFEPKTEEERDCHWSFWGTGQHVEALKSACKGTWKRWQLIDHERKVVHESVAQNYITLSASEYLKLCKTKLSPKIQLVRNPVKKIDYKNNVAFLSAGDISYTASHVFDSRPPEKKSGGLIQHFLGREIRTKEPITESDTVTLMDFRVDQSRGLHFIYALPFSDTHLLVESTMISNSKEPQQWYLETIDHWLNERGISVESDIGCESGIIPMDNCQPQDSRTSAIGAASGAIRQSSGYSFNYIQQQTKQLAGRISRGCYEVPAPISGRLVFMDRLFNRVLIKHPELSVNLFMQMAGALDGEQFARFMTGTASFSEWGKVILSMPKTPFLRNIWSV